MKNMLLVLILGFTAFTQTVSASDLGKEFDSIKEQRKATLEQLKKELDVEYEQTVPKLYAGVLTRMQKEFKATDFSARIKNTSRYQRHYEVLFRIPGNFICKTTLSVVGVDAAYTDLYKAPKDYTMAFWGARISASTCKSVNTTEYMQETLPVYGAQSPIMDQAEKITWAINYNL